MANPNLHKDEMDRVYKVEGGGGDLIVCKSNTADYSDATCDKTFEEVYNIVENNKNVRLLFEHTQMGLTEYWVLNLVKFNLTDSYKSAVFELTRYIGGSGYNSLVNYTAMFYNDSVTVTRDFYSLT